MMIVLIIENASNRLIGRLKLWAIEVKAGVYITDVNQRMRESIWDYITKNIGDGSAVMLWSVQTKEFGFDIRLIGECSRFISEIDGIKLIGKYC